MLHYPIKLELAGENRLQVTWDDNLVTSYSFHQLREACPCATCREKHGPRPAQPANLLTVLSPAEARPLKITDMQPVGNYAYSIQFSDGHDSGIYTLELLRALGETPGE